MSNFLVVSPLMFWTLITLRDTIFVWLLFLMPFYVLGGAELKNHVSFFVSSTVLNVLTIFDLSE